ncbi:MAG: hypothetical protein SH817_12160 [Leptospira sp.]|nr:hypothetical protein [Leptospira sp.]
MPTFEGSYSKFIREYEAYFNDHFGFRNFFVYSGNYLLIKIFNQSSSDKVILGKNKWLFFAGEDGAFHFKEKDYDKEKFELLYQKLDNWVKYFNESKIPFLFFIAPDKQSVYGEYLKEPQSEWAKNKNLPIISRELEIRIPGNFINSLTLLNEFKNSNKKLYFKADSHWNDTGAHFVYSNAIDKLKTYPSLKNLPQLTFDHIRVVKQRYTGDLIRIFWGIADLYDEDEYFFIGPSKLSIKIESIANDYKGIPIMNEFLTATNPNLKTQGKTLVAIRDSQFIPMIYFFAESFHRVILINVWEDKETIRKIIEMEKPDAVIFESVERGLVKFLDKM